MPLFFLIAGYLFDFEKYKDKFKLLCTSSFQRLILPAITAYCFFYSYNASNFWMRVKNLLYASGKSIPDFDISSISYSLWFLFCLFVLRILLFGFLKITDKYKIHDVVNIILAFLLSLLGVFIGKHIKLPWSIDIAFGVMYIAYIGYLLKKHNILEKTKIYYLVIPFIAIVLFVWNCVKYKYFGLSLNERYYSIPIISLNLSLILSFIAISISKFLEKINIGFLNLFFKYLGINSIVILIFHTSVYYSKDNLLCTVGRIFICFFVIEFLALIPGINKIFGAKSLISIIKNNKI